MKAVADTSSLIHPAKVAAFWKAMRETFEQILIPKAVRVEILKGKQFDSPDVPVIEKSIEEGWIKVVMVKAESNLPENLGEGEKEAITLMKREIKSVDWLLIDDEIASRTARYLGLPARSTSYLPIYWVKMGVIESSKGLRMLDDLVREGYRLSPKDYVAIKDLLRKL